MRNWRVTAEVGVPLAVIDVRGAPPTMLRLVTLEEFNIQNGAPRWSFRDSAGTVIDGTAEAPYPLWPQCRVILSVPITLHKRRRTSFAPDFIFTVPRHVEVHPVSELKRRFPDVDRHWL